MSENTVPKLSLFGVSDEILSKTSNQQRKKIKSSSVLKRKLYRGFFEKLGTQIQRKRVSRPKASTDHTGCRFAHIQQAQSRYPVSQLRISFQEEETSNHLPRRPSAHPLNVILAFHTLCFKYISMDYLNCHSVFAVIKVKIRRLQPIVFISSHTHVAIGFILPE